MIKFEDSQIIDILPNNLIDADVTAVSYALNNAIRKIIQYSKRICIYCNIDCLSENIVDYLAAELRTQYYDETFSLDVKRALVKNTIVWYFKSGTPAAVDELVNIAFGTGEVKEWFDINEESISPGEFDIITDSEITEDNVVLLSKMIDNIKNVRSHLRKLSLMREIEDSFFVSSENIFVPHITTSD